MMHKKNKRYKKKEIKTARLLTAIGAAAAIFILPLQSRALDILPAQPQDTIYNPNIIYTPLPKSYEIAGIRVSGLKNVEDYVIIPYSGLTIGEKSRDTGYSHHSRCEALLAPRSLFICSDKSRQDSWRQDMVGDLSDTTSTLV